MIYKFLFTIPNDECLAFVDERAAAQVTGVANNLFERSQWEGNQQSGRRTHTTSWRHFERALTKWLTSKLAAPSAF